MQPYRISASPDSVRVTVTPSGYWGRLRATFRATLPRIFWVAAFTGAIALTLTAVTLAGPFHFMPSRLALLGFLWGVFFLPIAFMILAALPFTALHPSDGEALLPREITFRAADIEVVPREGAAYTATYAWFTEIDDGERALTLGISRVPPVSLHLSEPAVDTLYLARIRTWMKDSGRFS